MTPEQRLIERMTSYRGGFEGYPSMRETDLDIIQEAIEANKKENGEDFCTDMGYLCYLASEHCNNIKTYSNAKRYLMDYMENVWQCNMMEGDNKTFEFVTERLPQHYSHLESGAL